MFVCKVLFFCTFHLSSFLPPFRPYPPCSMPDYPPPTLHITLHHPAPHRTTPHTHHTTFHHHSTPLSLWAVLSLRSAPQSTFHAPQSTSNPLHHNSPQHCTQLHNVVKSSTNLVISTIHTSHNVVQSEITHYILYTFLF